MSLPTKQEIQNLHSEIKDEYLTGKLGVRTCHFSLFDGKLKKMLQMSLKEKKF